MRFTAGFDRNFSLRYHDKMLSGGKYRSIVALTVAAIGLLASGCQSFPEQKSSQQSLTQWVRSNAIPLETVEPGVAGDDMDAFGEMIGDARLVALGEPTHGNREVFTLKHRMFEYLVQEKGFRIFAIEAPFAETEDLNAYVLHGHGSAQEALASLTMWAWDTKEVGALLDWMREYNTNPANAEKLKVYGFDPQSPERAVRLTLEYLQRVDLNFAAGVHNQLAGIAVPYSDPDELGWRPIRPAEANEAAKTAAHRIVARFEEQKASYIAATSEAEWSRHRQYARMVALWIDMNHDDGARWQELREQGMLSNVRWMMEANGPQSKAVLWAHNTHVADVQAARWGNLEFAGRLWRKEFGDDLRIVGFRFNQGDFTALKAVAGGELETFKLRPAETGLFEAELAKAGEIDLLLDLQEIPDRGPVAAYFAQPRKSRFSGGGYDYSKPERYYFEYLVPEAFDIIAYVHRTTPTRHFNRADYAHVQRIAQPANLDFESSTPGEVPADWFAWSKMERWGYSAATDASTFYTGVQSARLCRESGRMSDDVSGSLLQYIDATSFRGRSLRIRMQAKFASETTTKARAFVRLKVSPPALDSAHDSLGIIYDSLDKHQVESEEWQAYELEASIPEHAGSIMFGVFLTGEGCVWLDSIEFRD